MMDDRIQEMMIYSVTEEMAFSQTETTTSYKIVRERFAADSPINRAIGISADAIYKTKQALIDSL